MITQTTIKLAARLYELRDTAKRLMGDKYYPRMAELRGVIESAQKALGLPNELAAAKKLCEHPECTGIQVCMLMAAAVEMIEPSQLPTSEPGQGSDT